MDAREARMRDAFNVQTVTLREVIQNWAGFGVALERLERTVREIQRDFNAKSTLHGHGLEDHATRIAALERGEGGG